MNKTIKYINSSTTVDNIRNQCYELIDAFIEHENTSCKCRTDKINSTIKTYVSIIAFILGNIVAHIFIIKSHWSTIVALVLILVYDIYILLSHIRKKKEGKTFVYLTNTIMNTIKQEIQSSDDRTAMLEICSLLHSSEIDGMAMLWRDDIESILYNGKVLHISYKNGGTAALFPTAVREGNTDCITILKSGIFVGSQEDVKADVVTKDVNIIYYEDVDKSYHK